MRRFLIGIVASLTVSQATAAATLYPIDSDGLNLRAAPTTAAPVLRVLPAGEGVPVVGLEGKWLQVRLPDGRPAWAAGWVARVEFAPSEAEAVVTTDRLNVRAGPGLDHPIRTQVATGDRFPLLEIRGQWWRIRLPDGQEGWVFSEYLQAELRPAPGPSSAPAPASPGPSPTPTGSPPAPDAGPPSWLPVSSPAPAPAPASGPTSGPGAALPELPKQVTLVVDGEPVRLGRHLAYGSVDVARAGEPLAYLGAAEGWVLVETARGARGWVPGPQVNLQDQGADWDRAPLYTLAEGEWSIGFLPVRVVSDPDGLNLRTGPGLDHRVQAVLPQGTALKVLGRQGDWLEVALKDGRRGWVAGAYTAPVADHSARIERVRLHSPGPGLLRLELTGDLRGVQVDSEAPEGLLIRLPDPAGPVAHLPVEAHGVRDLAVTPAGVVVRFHAPPAYSVREQTSGRLVLEFRPRVLGVESRTEGDAVVYRFQVAGAVRPRVDHAGGDVRVDLPGAAVAAVPLPPGVSAEQTETGHLRFHIPSARPYAVKQVPGGFEVWFYGPGLQGKRILVDPGHGGDDTGAVNRALGLEEKAINLQVALLLKEELERRGAEVLLTRSDDRRPLPPEAPVPAELGSRTRADLHYRTVLANQAGVDLFISIHANAGGTSHQGTEVYYSRDNLNAPRSQYLASLIQSRLVGALGRPDRGVREEMFYVIKFSEAPAVLVELAFITHPEEAVLLASPDWQRRAAAAIADAVVDFYAGRP